MPVTFSGYCFPSLNRKNGTSKTEPRGASLSSHQLNQAGISLSGVSPKAAERLGVADDLQPVQNSAEHTEFPTTSERNKRESTTERFSQFLDKALNLGHYISPAPEVDYSNKAHSILGLSLKRLQVSKEPTSKKARHAQSLLNRFIFGRTDPKRTSVVGNHVTPNDILYENPDTLEHRSSRVPGESETLASVSMPLKSQK